MKKITLFDENYAQQIIDKYKLNQLDKNNIFNYFKTNFSDSSSFIKEWKIEERHLEGIYIFRQDEKVMYVGKAKSMIGRLTSHVKESQLEHKTARLFWCSFFNYLTQKEVEIITIHVSGELDRIVLEKILQDLHKPEFDYLKIKYKEDNKGKNPTYKNASENDKVSCKVYIKNHFKNLK